MRPQKFLSGLSIVLMTVLALLLTSCAPAHAQSVNQKSVTPKYVKTTEDTVTAGTGSSKERRTVLITAETVSGTANKDLKIYLSNNAGTKDTSTYFKIQNGKAYKVTFTGNRVYRKASADSVFSQVIFGDVELMNNLIENSTLQFTTVLKTDKVLIESIDLNKLRPMLLNRNYANKIYPRKNNYQKS